MRHRIEDLGRLSVLLDNILNYDIFDGCIYPSRPIDYDIWWSSLSEEKKDDFLKNQIHALQSIREKIYEMRDIAYGTDLLNEEK